MGVKIRINQNRLYLDVYVKGRRKWESLHLTLTNDKVQNREAMKFAEVARSKREQQLFSHEWGLLDPVASKQTLEGYAGKMAAPLGKGMHLPKALSYLREYGKGIRLEAIDETWLTGFKEFLLASSTIKQVTAAHYFAAVCHVLKQAHRERIIPRDPAINVQKIQEPEAMKVWLTGKELEILARTPLGGTLGAAIRRGFIFACMVGLRVSDVKSLKWGEITRTPSPMLMKRQRKTGGVVGIPINESAWAIIKDDAIHAPDELVFPALSLSLTSATQYFRVWTKAAGIDKKIGWHTARHTFAVLALEGGADLYTVSKLLGHTDIQTTQVYAKATDGMKRMAVDALPEIDLEKRGEVILMRKAGGEQ